MTGRPGLPTSSNEIEQRLARLVHELRAPLTAMLGYADQLIGDLPDRVEALQRLHVLRDNGEHLLQLVNGITHRARSDDADPVTEQWIRSQIDPIETIGAVAQLLRPCAEIKRLSLVARAEPPLPARIASDPLRVRQILFNLVGNAIKFTPEGGVLVTARSAGDELHFDVTDTGPGIAEERRAGLFHPFETGAGGSGDGLGLYISSRLAQALDGRLELAASGSEGCRFRLVLPATDAAEEVQPGDPRLQALERDGRAGRDQSPLTGSRVLVVEHGPDHQLLLSAVLKRAGCAVAIAGTGLKAIQIWERAQRTGLPFDLVILSEHLARKSGSEILSDLRARGFTGAAIGTISGGSGPARADFEAACDEILRKPIDPAVLRATLAGCLQPPASDGRFSD